MPIPSKDNIYWDSGLPGFGIKVTPKGRKVFVVLYRTGGAGSRLRKYTIGPYGRITLAMARGQAQKIFADINQEFPANPSVPPSTEVASWGQFVPDTLPVEVAGMNRMLGFGACAGG